VGEASGATWERFIEIRRAGDDRLLARGRSVYAALDPATGRPMRVEAEIRAPLEA
jgi:acyl-CoA thioester hydrolase